MSQPDPAAPTVCMLVLTGNDLQVIYGALDELPGKFSRPLYNKISGQVQAQIDAAAKKVAEPPDPPAPEPPPAAPMEIA